MQQNCWESRLPWSKWLPIRNWEAWDNYRLTLVCSWWTLPLKTQFPLLIETQRPLPAPTGHQQGIVEAKESRKEFNKELIGLPAHLQLLHAVVNGNLPPQVQNKLTCTLICFCSKNKLFPSVYIYVYIYVCLFVCSKQKLCLFVCLFVFLFVCLYTGLSGRPAVDQHQRRSDTVELY